MFCKVNELRLMPALETVLCVVMVCSGIVNGRLSRHVVDWSAVRPSLSFRGFGR